MNTTGLVGMLASTALSLVGCCPDEATVRSTWDLGILPGARDVTCHGFNGDSSVISFSYVLPAGMTPREALTRLRAQIPIRASGCFELIKESDGYLVMACRDKGSPSYGAWEVQVQNDRVQIIAGPPDYVLPYLARPVATRASRRTIACS
jgi:hypothetical protein